MAYALEKAPRTTLALGEVLTDAATGSRFRVTGFIGRGGMGEVYAGEAEGSGAVVAIKTIPLALVDDPKIALRTQFESSALRALRHRNVVKVFTSGVREDGVIFMIMEYLPGLTLLDLRRTMGKIPIAWSLEIARDAGLGLLAIHSYAVHRDVKPANLHFGVDAIVRVLDLGAARWNHSGMRLTTAGMQMGTLAYMAPEALDESAPVDIQADIWSLGVVLYELLADQHPFKIDGRLPDNQFLLGTRILDAPHPPLRDVAPLCPGQVALIVDKMLAKDPRVRHASVGDLVLELSRAMEAFAREHGAAPPLAELAAQIFPGAARTAQKRESAPGLRDLKHLQSTAPLDPKSRPAQPAALPYLRTEGIPAAIVTAAGKGPAPALVASASALAPPAVRPSEPEPPRVSDVFLRRPRLQETVPDLPVVAPATVHEAVSAGGAPATLTWRRLAVVAGVAVGAVLLVLIGAGVTTVAVGAWAPSSPGPSASPGAGTGAPGGATVPSAAAVASAAPSSARSATPSPSSSPRRGPAARPSPTHSVR